MNVKPEKTVVELLKRPIVLVGMMGTGKTTIGDYLARSLSLPFVDVDKLIEEQEKTTITEIFKAQGEEAFRQKEQEVITRVLTGDVAVISVGGGAFVQLDVRKAVKQSGYSIWLDVDVDTLCLRVKGQGNRPLLNGGNIRQSLQDILEKRREFYKQADMFVSIIGNESVEQSCERVMKQLYSFLSGR